MLVSREAFDYLGWDISEATVAIQGYGNAGSVAAALLDDLGANIVAVSDSSGAIHNPDGMDASAIKDHKLETGTVSGYEEATESMTNEDLLTMDVDLLVPAALENAIDERLAREVSADMIVEAANGPLTPNADDVLADSDVHVFPDILANAGGVTVSYFEWVQNRQRFHWTEQRVNDELERIITEAFEDLVDVYESADVPNFRTAMYVVAIRRVLQSARESGVWA
jgi:glutamate dehydrogenase/leucine dehydrogenase